MLWRLSLPAKHWLSFFFFLVILKKWREEWALQPTLLCSVNFACHCPPSETASLFYQSSPSALCLAFGAGMCATSKRAGITMVFFLRFFFFFFLAMPRGMWDLHSPVPQTRGNPGSLQWKCGVLTTELPEKSSSLSTCNVGDLGLILGLGRSPEKGKGYPLQYFGLENSLELQGIPWSCKESDTTE